MTITLVRAGIRLTAEPAVPGFNPDSKIKQVKHVFGIFYCFYLILSSVIITKH